jgi:hypothetical protein
MKMSFIFEIPNETTHIKIKMEKIKKSLLLLAFSAIIFSIYFIEKKENSNKELRNKIQNVDSSRLNSKESAMREAPKFEFSKLELNKCQIMVGLMNGELEKLAQWFKKPVKSFLFLKSESYGVNECVAIVDSTIGPLSCRVNELYSDDNEKTAYATLFVWDCV